jgi:hypothetical protein
MKTVKKKRKGQSGEIAMFVVFILLFMMLFISLFVTQTLLKQTKAAINVASSVQAFYIANSGAEYALYHIMRDCPTGDDPNTCVAGFTFPGGDCTISVPDPDLSIYITGTYRGQTSRAIQLSWPEIIP